VESVRKTAKVVLVSEEVERGSVMQTVAANLTQLCFDDLDAPPAIVGARNWITPAAELDSMFFPQPSWVLDAIHEFLLPLPAYQSITKRTKGELMRRARLGI
jgi:2-oxoisovalerate dehydrogenase E1 component